jgi:hypothetical protein
MWFSFTGSGFDSPYRNWCSHLTFLTFNPATSLTHSQMVMHFRFSASETRNKFRWSKYTSIHQPSCIPMDTNSSHAEIHQAHWWEPLTSPKILVSWWVFNKLWEFRDFYQITIAIKYPYLSKKVLNNRLHRPSAKVRPNFKF